MGFPLAFKISCTSATRSTSSTIEGGPGNCYIIIIIIIACQGFACQPVPSSNKKHPWRLWVTLFLLEQVTSRLKTPISWRTTDFIPGFLHLGYLLLLTSPAYPPRNLGRGPYHWASETWSSHKARSPLPVVELPIIISSFHILSQQHSWLRCLTPLTIDPNQARSCPCRNIDSLGIKYSSL
jgi:hypothetical protein